MSANSSTYFLFHVIYVTLSRLCVCYTTLYSTPVTISIIKPTMVADSHTRNKPVKASITYGLPHKEFLTLNLHWSMPDAKVALGFQFMATLIRAVTVPIQCSSLKC